MEVYKFLLENNKHDPDYFQKLSRELDILQSKENNERGIVCVKTIVLYLSMPDPASALRVRRLENDKIRSYPAIVEWLEANGINRE